MGAEELGEVLALVLAVVEVLVLELGLRLAERAEVSVSELVLGLAVLAVGVLTVWSVGKKIAEKMIRQMAAALVLPLVELGAGAAEVEAY